RYEISPAQDNGAGESGATDCHRGSPPRIRCVDERIRQRPQTNPGAILSEDAMRREIVVAASEPERVSRLLSRLADWLGVKIAVERSNIDSYKTAQLVF